MPVKHHHLRDTRKTPQVLQIAPPSADWLDHLPRHRHAIIMGAGPNGKPFHQSEPEGLKIALNCAIAIPWQWDIWMVLDQSAANYPWFKTPTSAHRVFGTEIAKIARHDVAFEYYPTVHNLTELTRGILHGGATVAGCAIQLAYWLGCERATLCGIDQWGDRHFDGIIGAPKHNGRVWTTVKHIEKIIRIVAAGGMSVDSISKTRLSVPVMKTW